MRLYRTERGKTKTWGVTIEGKKVTSVSGGAYEKQAKTTRTYGTPAKAKQAHLRKCCGHGLHRSI